MRAAWGAPRRRGTAPSARLRRRSPAAAAGTLASRSVRMSQSACCKTLLTVFFSPFLYLLCDLQMVVSLHLLQESTLAAGIEHPLFNVAAVPWHGVNEHCWRKNKKIKRFIVANKS